MHKYTTEELVAQKTTEEEFRRKKRNPIIFILHNIRSLENVGLFFRLADAVLAEKVYLTGYTGYPREEEDGREERITRHAEAEIEKTAIKLVPEGPWEHREDSHGLITELQGSGVQIAGVEQTDESQDYRTTDYRLPVALLFGHERTGVEEELLEKCDMVIHIPMLGMGNSHNVAMAGAIIANHILNIKKTK